MNETISALGSLVVATGNEADRKAICLTGSQIWNNFHDGMGPGAECAAAPECLNDLSPHAETNSRSSCRFALQLFVVLSRLPKHSCKG
jgi:hypothetical protein